MPGILLIFGALSIQGHCRFLHFTEIFIHNLLNPGQAGVHSFHLFIHFPVSRSDFLVPFVTFGTGIINVIIVIVIVVIILFLFLTDR